MTFGRLVRRDLLRNPLRLSLTVLAAAVGMVAFIFLQTVIDLWYAQVAASQADRLIVRNRTSLTQPLPLSYLKRLEALEGVDAITYASWFGGRIGESMRDFFPTFYVDTASYLSVMDEITVPPDQLSALIADPCAAVIGRSLANRYGWKVGERVTLHGTVFPGDWTFTIRGIYDGTRPSVDTTALVFGYRCLNERVPEDLRDLVGYYAIKVTDPRRSPALAAQVDALFANSPYETRTESEKAFNLSFVAMSGAILAAIRIVSYVILAIILLVVGNTVAMGVREKSVELATLRALGFRRRHLLLLVLSEAGLIGLLASALAVAAFPPILRGFVTVVSRSVGAMSLVEVRPVTLLLAVLVSLAVGLLAGAIPALRAARIPVAAALRRVA